MYNIPSSFSNNAILLISSPRDGEFSLSRKLHDDLSQFRISIGDFFHKSWVVQSKKELINVFHEIEVLAENGVLPIISLCMHGDKDKGLLTVGSGEFLSWNDLILALRRINVKTKNNVCVVSSACESYHMINAIKILEPVPFHTLIAPEEMVSFGFIDDNFSRFYRKILESNDLNNAFLDISSCFKSFNCQKIFVTAFGQYIKYFCMGKTLHARKEQLTTIALNVTEERNLKRIRKEIKSKIKPNQFIMDKYASNFLINKNHGIRFDEIMRLIRESKP